VKVSKKKILLLIHVKASRSVIVDLYNVSKWKLLLIHVMALKMKVILSVFGNFSRRKMVLATCVNASKRKGC
jgi:hypothetical protein